MERGNTTHGPKLDEELEHETEGAVRSGGKPNRAEDFRGTEAMRPDPGEEPDRMRTAEKRETAPPRPSTGGAHPSEETDDGGAR